MNISPLAELAVGQPFSSPFQITNTGYLTLHVEHVTVIWPQVDGRRGDSVVYLTNTSANSRWWDNFELQRGAKKTILAQLVNIRPTRGVIVIAVDYKCLGIQGRWLSRFDGLYIDHWQWAEEPINETEREELNKQVDHSLSEHRRAMARYKPN